MGNGFVILLEEVTIKTLKVFKDDDAQYKQGQVQQADSTEPNKR